MSGAVDCITEHVCTSGAVDCITEHVYKSDVVDCITAECVLFFQKWIGWL